MIPRGKLDISWSDILFGIKSCIWQKDREMTESRIESLWSPSSDTMVCLSVRSGFDLLLQALEFSPGSEILVSAVAHRDIARIIEHHGLVPVPIDIDVETLSVKTDCLARALSKNAKAILIAHLFGSRMLLDEIVSFAKQHGLYLIEDCAQTYAGHKYRGHSQSDVTMFSFGPTKTNTALGGGLLRFKDSSLLSRVRTLQLRYPLQSRWQFLGRLSKYAILKCLSSPVVFGIFEALCRLLRKSHDQIISGAVTGFAGPDFFTSIRQQPCYPLLALLQRRLKNFDSASIELRVAVAHRAIELMCNIRRPGEKAGAHTHWLFPIQVTSPDRLMQYLWREGFDATRGASSLCVVKPPADRRELTPTEAQQVMERVLYLPVYPGVSVRDLKRLASVTSSFEKSRASVTAENLMEGGPLLPWTD